MDNSLRTAVLLLMGVVMIRVARMALEMAAEFFPMGRLHFLRTNANVVYPVPPDHRRQTLSS